MPYVQRGDQGEVIGRYANYQDYAQEWLDDDHPDLQRILTLRDYDIAIERELDADAEAAGYRDPLGRIPSIDRACSYAGYPNPYQEEAQKFVLRRALAWQYAYQVKSAVEVGEREQPTIEQLISELPPRVTAQ
jgi:hypothetical protein